MKKIIYKIGMFLTFILILYALYGSIFVEGKLLFNHAELLNILLTIIIIAVFTMAIIILIYLKMMKWNREKFLLISSLLTIVIRMLLMFVLDTKPISDFAFFHRYAVKFSHGDFMAYDRTYLLFPHKFGYPLILSVVYKFFGSNIFVGKMFNIFISVGIMICIYFCAKKIFDETSARFACIIFIFYPSQIMYSSVLATENIFTLFFIIAILLFCNYKSCLAYYKICIILIAVGISLAVSNFIRPVAPVLLAAMVLYCLIFPCIKNEFKKNLLIKGIFATIIIASYMVTYYSISRVVISKTKVDILKSCPEYSIMVGTDWRSGGFYSSNAQKIVEAGDYNTKKVKKLARIEIKKNIDTNNNKINFFMYSKYFSMWSDDTYGYNWSVKKVYKNNVINDFIIKHNIICYFFIQSYYNLILLIAAFAFLYLFFKSEITDSIFISIIFIGFVISHTILEVQSRYHYPISVLFIIISGFGFKIILNVLKDKKISLT